MPTSNEPEGKKPVPEDDPLAKLIDNFSEEIDPVEVPATIEAESEAPAVDAPKPDTDPSAS